MYEVPKCGLQPEKNALALELQVTRGPRAYTYIVHGQDKYKKFFLRSRGLLAGISPCTKASRNTTLHSLLTEARICWYPADQILTIVHTWVLGIDNLAMKL